MNDEIFKVASSALKEAENRITADFRYLVYPLGLLAPGVAARGTIATDGRKLTVGAENFCRIVATDGIRGGERAVLHALFHVLFFHPFRIKRPVLAYDLACDIAVEFVLDGLQSVDDRAGKVQRNAVYSAIKTKFGSVGETAAFDYCKALGEDETERLKQLFTVCYHGGWYGRNSDGQSDAPQENEPSAASAQSSDDEGGADENSISRWIEIVRGTLADMGESDETLKKTLLRVSSSRKDYRRFFEKFFALSERVKPSDDEFDYIFYCYGLQLYKNVPLIENLECSEGLAAEQIVFAVDTSASTEGEPVKVLLEELSSVVDYAAMKSGKVKVRVIQCDMAIREDVTLNGKEELDEYFKNFNLQGGSGTDFAPVFDLLEKEVAGGARIRGLIYFTDGLAKFPLSTPPFKTCFAVCGDDDGKVIVPPYALRLDIPLPEKETKKGDNKRFK